jgi:nucleoside-diphosphate-sugar epimerase
MILITGAAGFIGRHVCSLLSQKGVDILAVDRATQESVTYRTATGDLSDDSFLADLFGHHRIDVLIHLASLLNTASRLFPQEALRVNVGASLKMIELAVRAGVSRFLYGSSISAYGTKRLSDSGHVSESTSAAPTDVYGITKRYVEIVGEAIRSQSGLGFVALRLPIVVGAGVRVGSSVWRGLLFESPAVGHKMVVDIPFRPDEMIPLAHVDDVAEMISQVVTAEHIPSAIYNACSENWLCGNLASYVRSLCEQRVVVCGQATVEGIPQAIDSRLFTNTFGFNSHPLRERLRACHRSA